MSSRLFDLLVADIPSGFCTAALDRMQRIYPEAYESVKNDPRFGEPEVKYMHGHTRRALVEFGLRELAVAHKVKVEMKRAEGFGGPEHVMLSSGRFCFTACHVPSMSTFPRDSRYREQYSAINEHVTQGQLFAVASNPAEADIYGIIIHCEAVGSKSKLGTLSIGFPNQKYNDWIDEPIALVDIADAQARLHQKEQPGSAEPKWKKKKDTGEKGD